MKLFTLLPRAAKKIDVKLKKLNGCMKELDEYEPRSIRIESLTGVFAMYLIIVRDIITKLIASVSRSLKNVRKVIWDGRGRRAWGYQLEPDENSPIEDTQCTAGKVFRRSSIVQRERSCEGDFLHGGKSSVVDNKRIRRTGL
jgi:hypothetical protein